MPLFDGNIHLRRDFSLQPDVGPEAPLNSAKSYIPSPTWNRESVFEGNFEDENLPPGSFGVNGVDAYHFVVMADSGMQVTAGVSLAASPKEPGLLHVKCVENEVLLRRYMHDPDDVLNFFQV